ncbi:MAG TPA: large conductance mechanosensitive channel protein MscL, partial [Porphyromonadaceae bacterium]|nr:large conductance mechanosensitive channel protein MscL [Porphyromonadaceae bacterium]
PISLLLKDGYFSDVKLVLRQAVLQGDEIITPAITWNFGSFLQAVLDFLIVGTAIFLVIKGMNKLKRK